MVTTYLGARHPARLIGIHLSIVVAFRDDSLPRSDDDLSEQERIIAGQTCGDGESNWLEGAQLLAST